MIKNKILNLNGENCANIQIRSLLKDEMVSSYATYLLQEAKPYYVTTELQQKIIEQDLTYGNPEKTNIFEDEKTEKTLLILNQDYSVLYEIDVNLDWPTPKNMGLSVYAILKDNVIFEHLHIKFYKGEYKVHVSEKQQQLPEFYLNGAYLAAFILTFVMFKKWPPLEMRIMESNSQQKKRDNISKEDKIQIIGLDWGVEIIRDTPFPVQGHYATRLCGPGRTEKRQVWIDSFQKNGYHRKAKVLRE